MFETILMCGFEIMQFLLQICGVRLQISGLGRESFVDGGDRAGDEPGGRAGKRLEFNMPHR